MYVRRLGGPAASNKRYQPNRGYGTNTNDNQDSDEFETNGYGKVR